MKNTSPVWEPHSAQIKAENKGADNLVNFNRIWVSSFTQILFFLNVIDADEAKGEGRPALTCME